MYTPEVQEAQRLKASLAEFVKAAWPVVEGSRPLKWNWHLDAICAHLQAAFEGRIASRIIFNVPPRTSKSTIVSVAFPAWAWARKPWLQMMFASHKIELARDFAYKRRAILESEWYRNLFGEDVRLKADRANIVEIATEDQGVMYTTTAGGSSTGRGADVLLQDDPNSAEEMESELERVSKLRWVDVTWSNRANDPARVLHFVIQQRTHTEDISGHLLAQGGWLHVRIPMEFEPSRRSTTPIWTDPRAAKGELLDAVRFPPEYVAQQRRVLGPYFYAGQYDQEPFPLGGGMVKAAWFQHFRADADQPGHLITIEDGGLYTFDPMRAFRFCVVDPAVTSKEIGEKKLSDPDYTVIMACAALATPRGAYLFLVDLIRDRMEGPAIIPRLQAMHRHWRFSVIGIETVAFQLMLFQQAKRVGLPVREISTRIGDEEAIYRIDKDKEGRVMAATPMLADRRCFLPEYAPWLADFLAEVTGFPNSSHDDMTDCLAYSVAIASKYKGERIHDRPDDGTAERRARYPDVNRDRPDDRPPDKLANWYGAKPPGV